MASQHLREVLWTSVECPPLCFPASLDSAGQLGHQGRCKSGVFNSAWLLKDVEGRIDIFRLPEQPMRPVSLPTTQVGSGTGTLAAGTGPQSPSHSSVSQLAGSPADRGMEVTECAVCARISMHWPFSHRSRFAEDDDSFVEHREQQIPGSIRNKNARLFKALSLSLPLYSVSYNCNFLTCYHPSLSLAVDVRGCPGVTGSLCSRG